MKKRQLKLIAILIALLMILTSGFVNVYAVSNTSENEKSKLDTYSADRIVLDNSAFETEGDIKFDVKSELMGCNNVIVWENGYGTINWDFNIEKTAEYNLYFKFKTLNNDQNISLKVKIDGKNPFENNEEISLTADWIDSTDGVRKDDNGNEFSPEQVQSETFFERYAVDETGVLLEPYKISLDKGVHSLTLIGKGYSVAIAEIAFTAPEVLDEYSEISKGYDFNKSKAKESIYIHAEKASLKSDNKLIPMSTSGDAGMYPIDASSLKLNYIGGSNWNSPHQKITWNFTASEEGYYKFGARFKQNELINGESWRWLKIDGKTPFKEAKELRFKFGANWDYFEFGEDGEFYIWLDKGEHTLSLEVTLGEMSEYYERLNEVVTVLGDLYLQIVMITGETPDVNRDYELFRQIPDFLDILSDSKKKLESIVDDMQNSVGKEGSQYIAAANNMIRVIDNMVEVPYLAHIYVKDFYTNYSTLCSWLSEIKKMPLAIDELQFTPYGTDFNWDQPNFFEKILFAVKRFVLSFTEDYTTKQKNEGSLKLWVNWGRDQTMALDSLIKESFTEKTGIEVELQIVSNSLINGLLSGDYPDLQLHLSRIDPINFGMRGALTDLTEFSDYEEVLTRFMPGADTPYWYNGALYALPDQQTFYCMFYRRDVFEQLNLEVPTTWDEFLEAATIIQSYNMSVYVPYTQIATTTTVNSGIGSLNLYPTLMLQNNLSLYNDKLNKTDLTNAKAINVFADWTKMYSDYGYLKEADFYNRFRNGSMPLGIAPYTTYMTLYSAAPEIQGRWDIANVPGTKNGNNLVAGGGSGCSIVKQSKNQEEAWEFLKWWTEAETQVRYCNNVESVLGMLGRIPTSNVEAFNNFSWEPETREKLMNQWKCVKEVPEVPGGYYLTRAVDQAFWSVLNDKVTPKDSITKWSKTADNEIKRKIKEYS